jgi:hypothetical protein
LSAPLGKLECRLNTQREATANEIIPNIVAWLVQEMGEHLSVQKKAQERFQIATSMELGPYKFECVEQGVTNKHDVISIT